MKSLGFAILVAALMLPACTDLRPSRIYVLPYEKSHCPKAHYDSKTEEDNCARTTPEVVENTYELHFVEFDDQGQLYPDRPGSNENPDQQISSLMKRLHELLENKADISIIVYVHGWKHDAVADDSNLVMFRSVLQAVGERENRTVEPEKRRRIVGIYVGWRGATWPGKGSGEVMDLSFWGRKGAAARIAQGSARELLARLHAMQRRYNAGTPAISPDHPTKTSNDESSKPRPRIRTLMIAHSFGAAILYEATEGPLIEVLSREGDDRAERLADMIVLINPAIEAVRYAPLYKVARSYHSSYYEPPLLVTISTCEDQANRLLFPLGRFVTSIFERPTSSSTQSWDLDHTYGHVDQYITHHLYAHVPTPDSPAGDKCPLWKPLEDLKVSPSSVCPDPLDRQQREPEQAALTFAQSTAFFNDNLQERTNRLPSDWGRVFCGGLYLRVHNHPDQQPEPDNANAIIWNVETDGQVIRSHSDLAGNEKLISFIEQLYGDVALNVLAPSNDKPSKAMTSGR